MRIKDILDKKGSAVRTIGPDETVAEAVSQLCEHRIGALVVVGDGGKIAGIISERDLLRESGEVFKRLADPARAAGPVTPKRVKDIMSKSLIIGLPDDTVDYVMGVMTHNRVRHLPVVAEGKLIGIVSIGDVVNASLGETTYENRLLKDYIHGAIAVG
jgi:CBS domain-containing protein